MELSAKMELLYDVFEAEEGEIVPETELGDLDNWDSMTRLSLIVMLDEEFGKSVSGEEVRAFETIQDILDVMVQE